MADESIIITARYSGGDVLRGFAEAQAAINKTGDAAEKAGKKTAAMGSASRKGFDEASAAATLGSNVINQANSATARSYRRLLEAASSFTEALSTGNPARALVAASRGALNLNDAFAVSASGIKNSASASQSRLQLFDVALQKSGGGAKAAGELFKSFQSNLLLAGAGIGSSARVLARDFATFGVDVEQALLKPEKAYEKFLASVAGNKSKGALSSARRIFGIGADDTATIRAVQETSAALNGMTNAEDAAAAGATGLSAALVGAIALVAALAVGAVTVVVGLISMGRAGLELADNLREASIEGGLTVDTLQRLKAAGSDFGATNSAFAAFKDKLHEAATEGGALDQIFRQLGINAKSALKDPEDAFNRTGRALAALQDQTLRIDAAQTIFGGTGAKVADAYATLTGNVGAFNNELNRTGSIIDTKSNPAFEQARKISLQLQAQLDALKIQVASELGPSFIEVFDAMAKAIDRLKPLIIGTASLLANLAVGFLNLISTGLPVTPKEIAAKQAAGGPTGSNAYAAASFFTAQGRSAAKAGLRGALDNYNYDNSSASKATKQADDSKALRSALLAEAEAANRAETNLVKEQLSEQEKLLKSSYDRRLVNAEEYYGQKLRLDQDAIRAELAANQKTLSLADEELQQAFADPQGKTSERVRIQTRINTLAGERDVLNTKRQGAARAKLSGSGKGT